MAFGVLYTYPENFRAYKVLIAAQYSGVQLQVSENFVFGKTNKTQKFLRKFPLGKVPAFEADDGRCITESNAIAYYVANDKLRGNSDFQKAEIIQWLSFADSEILPSSCAWVFPLLGIMPYDKQTVKNAKADLAKSLTVLNTHLSRKTYLVGERITLADISVAMTLLHLYQYVLEPKVRQNYRNVNRWFQTIINQPEVIAVIGNFKLAEAKLGSKPVEYEPKKCNQAHGEKKEKEEPAEDLDIAEPKSSNPFDAMPSGAFSMDDFKRSYSNEDESVSVPYFWKKFDPDNYSIWLGEYKYNHELTKVFMSCNLISGMFQRLDKMRKQAFGSFCLYGTDNDSSISGIFIWRGQDLAFTQSPDWQVDYESYTWTKLDPKDEKTKEIVNEYLTWTGKDKEGRKFNQGKIFK